MKIAVIGAGEMGGAFATGLLNANLTTPENITVANPHEEKLKPFVERGTSVTTDNKVAAAMADIVVLAVKPKVVKGVIDEIKEEMDYSEQTIVNMAASIKLDQLEAWLLSGGDVPPICQAIPNIAIAKRQSMTFLTPNSKAAANIKPIQDIFNALGKTMVVDEDLLAAGTAMAGCGIALVLRFVRAASEAGVELGFRADDAKNVVMQTIEGAKTLLAEGGHPEAIIDKVTTPGGMTIKGLNAMEEADFTRAVIAGFKGCLK